MNNLACTLSQRTDQVTLNRSAPSSSPTRCRQTHQRAEPPPPRRTSERPSRRAGARLPGLTGEGED
ncbi:hypothetical protein PAMP_013917 [Pampus punctatissimus]